jgi:hypothetical protein
MGTLRQPAFAAADPTFARSRTSRIPICCNQYRENLVFTRQLF